MKKGKFIVIDGSESSGKATQAKLLTLRLRRAGYKVATIDFPRYYHTIYGELISRYLRGEFGKKVNPYLAAVLYAGDRLLNKDKITKWLLQGKIVIADRYVSANQIHQTAKIKGRKEKEKFLAWIEKLEYQIHKIPKPNLVIYLYVPVKDLLQLKKKKEERKYLAGKKDIHESNTKYLRSVEKQALALAKKYKDWKMINCTKSGKLLSIEEISERIWKTAKKII